MAASPESVFDSIVLITWSGAIASAASLIACEAAMSSIPNVHCATPPSRYFETNPIREVKLRAS